jgi:hypothetical protein
MSMNNNSRSLSRRLDYLDHLRTFFILISCFVLFVLTGFDVYQRLSGYDKRPISTSPRNFRVINHEVTSRNTYIGDGLTAPSTSAVLLSASAANFRIDEKQHVCDRVPWIKTDGTVEVEKWRRNIFVPPLPWAPYSTVTELIWKFATISKSSTTSDAMSSSFSTTVQATEMHRFTNERKSIIESYAPALEVPNVEHMHIMSPALIWIEGTEGSGGGKYLSFVRVSNYPDELYDNFLWVQEFTPSLQVIPFSGKIVGLPTHSANLMAPGPEDPRALIFKGDVLVVFNLQFRNNDRRQVIYNHNTLKIVVLSVEGLTLQRAEKNWMPFIFEDNIHFIYQLDPLVVLKCDIETGKCNCVVPSCVNLPAFNTRNAIARGGTSMVKVAENLYFGFLHSTFRGEDHAIRGHMMLFSTAPMGIVAVSSEVPYPDALLFCYMNTVPWDVQFPSSVTLLGGDLASTKSLLLGVHVRDAMSSLLLLELNEPLLDTVKRVRDGACIEGGNTGEVLNTQSTFMSCKKWKVYTNGQIDNLLKELLKI